MTRRPMVAILAVLVLAAGATAALILSRDRETRPPAPEVADRADGLTLVIVRTQSGPYAGVVGSTGGEDGALVLPTRIRVTIPGQGEGTLGEALELPAEQAVTTVANLLGVWVDHTVAFGRQRLSGIVDRQEGIDVGGSLLLGDEVVELLEGAGDGGMSAFQLVLQGLLTGGIEWSASDLPEADAPSAVLGELEAVQGAPVTVLPSEEAATGIYRSEPEVIRSALVEAFGGPDREVIGTVVLNGSGVPGIGELVAALLVPDGFRVVISDNASSFDHDETLVVVGSADDVALGERVRDLLGVGSVNVSVASGIAPVTIVVGKDFSG
jgi:hypothetical protein